MNYIFLQQSEYYMLYIFGIMIRESVTENKHNNKLVNK